MANETAQKPETDEAKLARIARAYEKNGTMESGYSYRWVTSGGRTFVVARPIRRKKG